MRYGRSQSLSTNGILNWYMSSRELIQPCLHDGILAPINDQCMQYATWLHVYGKMRKHLPARTAALVDSYIISQ